MEGMVLYEKEAKKMGKERCGIRAGAMHGA
jgi:hypothetical protein